MKGRKGAKSQPKERHQHVQTRKGRLITRDSYLTPQDTVSITRFLQKKRLGQNVIYVRDDQVA